MIYLRLAKCFVQLPQLALDYYASIRGFTMRNPLRKLATGFVALVAAAFMTVVANSTFAQQQRRSVSMSPAMERRETDMARERQMRELEELRQSLGKRPVRAANLRYLQAINAQLMQDFERIQVARNKIVRAAANDKAFDYKFISEVTDEIKKRASRLESNLALPEPEENEASRKNQVELNETQIRTSLLTLCNRIESFVKSPLFETPGVIDVHHSTKASSDLKSILELSGSIRKSAERLKKAQPQP